MNKPLPLTHAQAAIKNIIPDLARIVTSTSYTSSKYCPPCLAEGRGEFLLQCLETWSGGIEPDGIPRESVHQVSYTCPHCGTTYDSERRRG